MSESKKFQELFTKSLPFFNALGHPVRQKLMLMMTTGAQLSVKELTAGTKLSRPTVSHHLKILKNAHLIVEHKKGRETYYHPQPGEHFHTVKELIDTIDKAIKHNEGTTK
ncbi:MAG: metalloregulator ArsR/SmtB family transcription factor [Candidatus Saccharimonadales bacterium]